MNESGTGRLFWGAVAATTLGVVLVLMWPKVAEELRPVPVTAHLAIAGADGVSRFGTTTLLEGERATLHAVLEAEDRSGKTVYYTEAQRLEVNGVEVDAERLRIWDRPEPLTILWFSVEVSSPFQSVEDLDSIASFRFVELFHPDWPQAWSVPVIVTPRHAAHLRSRSIDPAKGFGIRRYHVRLEQRDPDRPALVTHRFRSPGADQVFQMASEFPTVVSLLSGPLAKASRVFGLTQMEPTGEVEREVLEALSDFASNDFAFSRATLLLDVLSNRAPSLAALPWRTISLHENDLVWGEDVAAGDLLRVGGRVALLYRDEGIIGQLDSEDLCLDFKRGAIVNTLEKVYGEDGLVEWGSLPGGEVIQ